MHIKQFRAAFLSVCALCLTCAQASAAEKTLPISGATDMVFGANNVLYVTAGTNIVRYDVSGSAFLPSWNLGGSLMGIDLSPNGQTLAVADNTTSNGLVGINLVNATTGQSLRANFPNAGLEGGTYMVAWGANNQVYTTSTFQGSGWIPFRQYDPATTTTSVLGSVRQNTMLTPSADRLSIGIAQGNESGGPIGYWDVTNATTGVSVSIPGGWFAYEIASNKDGTQFAVPTYNGLYALDRQGNQQKVLGTYADTLAITGAYSPDGKVLYTAWWNWDDRNTGIKAYDTTTWQLLKTYDTYSFPWTGNHALGEGRMKVSPDGQYLAVTINGGVELINVPEPAVVAAALPLLCSLFVRRRNTFTIPT